MQTLPLSDVVGTMVRQFLLTMPDRGGSAMHFEFDIGLSHYTDQKSYHERCGLHLLYHSINNGSYVSVFSGRTERAHAGIGAVEEWVHEATHDSEWRNIDLFSKTYFGMANLLNERLAKDGYDSVAPRDMTEHNRFASFNSAFDVVEVQVSKDPKDKYQYRRLVKVLGK